MSSNERKMLHAYEPYRREALYCLRVDLLIVFCGAIIVTIAGMPRIWPSFYWIFPAYLLIELFLNYSLALIGTMEQRRELFIRRQVRIQKITREHSFSGRWGSVISKLYPPNLMVDRYKMICLDENGEKLTLRSAMSLKKYRLLIERIDPACRRYHRGRRHERPKPIDRTAPTELPLWTVTIGKYSHIILSYDDKDELCDFLNYQF